MRTHTMLCVGADGSVEMIEDFGGVGLDEVFSVSATFCGDTSGGR